MAKSNVHSTGRVSRSRRDKWQAFDACPPSVRQALRDAAFDWSAAWAEAEVKRQGAQNVVEMIAKADQVQTRDDQFKVWNITPSLKDLGL